MVAGWLGQEGLQTVLRLAPLNDSRISEHIQEFLFLPTDKPFPLPELSLLSRVPQPQDPLHPHFTRAVAQASPPEGGFLQQPLIPLSCMVFLRAPGSFP